MSRRPDNHLCADYRPLNWNFNCDRGGLLSNLQTESIIVIIRVWVVLERTMRVKVIIRGLCDGDSRMLISQPLSLTTILFRTTIIRTCRLHNQLLICKPFTLLKRKFASLLLLSTIFSTESFSSAFWELTSSQAYKQVFFSGSNTRYFLSLQGGTLTME